MRVFIFSDLLPEFPYKSFIMTAILKITTERESLFTGFNRTYSRSHIELAPPVAHVALLQISPDRELERLWSFSFLRATRPRLHRSRQLLLQIQMLLARDQTFPEEVARVTRALAFPCGFGAKKDRTTRNGIFGFGENEMRAKQWRHANRLQAFYRENCIETCQVHVLTRVRAKWNRNGKNIFAARSRETPFTRQNRRACWQAKVWHTNFHMAMW